MSRLTALAAAERYFDEGGFAADLARRVAIPTESQTGEAGEALAAYLNTEMRAALEPMGFICRILPNPDPRGGPLLEAVRREAGNSRTLLSYGHADVTRGQEGQWRAGLAPWQMTTRDGRFYGRGTADNKGQHSVNIAALAAVLAARGGRLGYDVVLLIETGEEIGSPGLGALCAAHKDAWHADLFLASDGPRVQPDRPTLYGGARGAMNFELSVVLREGAHHSGNWGGLLADPAIILSQAIASIVGPTGNILIPEWLPPGGIPDDVRAALRDCPPGGGDDAPAIDTNWGEPGFTPAEKVYGWCSFAVLAMTSGQPQAPVNAIAGRADATCQIRFVVGPDPAEFLPALRRHLDARGFASVTIIPAEKGYFPATRLEASHPAVGWAMESVASATGVKPIWLPNLGGSLPNEVFSQTLGLPTLWLPHSHAACSQHAPNEHMLASVARQGLAAMAGLLWDLGEPGSPFKPTGDRS